MFLTSLPNVLEFRAGPISTIKLSGHDVYCTNASLLAMKITLCGKLHHQRVLKLKLLSYTIQADLAQKIEKQAANVQLGPSLSPSHPWLRIQGSGFRVQGAGFRVQG